MMAGMRFSQYYILLFLFSFESFASFQKASLFWKKNVKNKEFKIANELIKSNFYYSALPYVIYLVENEEKVSPSLEKLLEKILLKTSSESFMGIDDKILKRHDTSKILSFITGMKMFDLGNYEEAINYLKKIPKVSKLFPESTLMIGSSYNLLGDYKNAKKFYEYSIKYAEKYDKSSSHEKLKRYYGVIHDNNYLHMARMHFKRKEFQEAIEVYGKIEKNSYQWPYLLLEKAWSNYYLENYNRTLGLLVTYKSPLLESYFRPESELLAVSTYMKLCQWNDALSTVNQYHKVYEKDAKLLKKLLVQNKNSQSYFLKLAFSQISSAEKKNPFIRNLITQVRKKQKFNIDMLAYKRAKKELKILKKIQKKNPFAKELSTDLLNTVNWRTRRLNHFVKKFMFDFINQIHTFSYEMFNLKLEILSRKRTILYSESTKENQGEISRNRGGVENINRTSQQHYWNFNGAFWADELGDYVFGLENRCNNDEG